MMPSAAVSMISLVFLTCPSLISIQDLRLQRIAPNQIQSAFPPRQASWEKGTGP